MLTRRERGFTIVELLVVIAIIGVLVALLMPAVQMAREAARRTQCTNNVKEQAKAIISYATSKGHLPAARHYGTQLGVVYGWVVPVLAELDQSGLRDSVRQGLPVDPTRLPILICPSAATVVGDYPLHYAVNGGRENVVTPAQGLNFDWPENGLMADLSHAGNPAFSLPPAGSVMSRLDPKPRLESVAKYDGTSSTILLAENCTLGNWLVADTQQDAELLWFAEDPAATPGFIGLNVRQPILGVTATYTDLVANVRFGRPASYHPGGFMLAMCDGSVQFMSETTNYRIYAVMMTPRGERANAPSAAALGSHANSDPVWQSPWRWTGSPPTRVKNAAPPTGTFTDGMTYPGVQF